MSGVRLYNSDPKVANDIFNKHNKNTDKIDETARLLGPLLGNSIIGAPTDEDWRLKRKACAHGFYKDRLRHMLEVLKDQIGLKITQWKSEIAANPEGTTQINIAHEFSAIFSQNLMVICFGEDMSDHKFEFEFMVDRTNKTFEKR